VATVGLLMKKARLKKTADYKKHAEQARDGRASAYTERARIAALERERRGDVVCLCEFCRTGTPHPTTPAPSKPEARPRHIPGIATALRNVRESLLLRADGRRRARPRNGTHRPTPVQVSTCERQQKSLLADSRDAWPRGTFVGIP
jgi:hypothetical protein